MIRAELFDLGTKFVWDPRNPIPGMDQGYYRELDMEYQFPGTRTSEINKAILEVQNPIQFRPWPRPFPGYLWIDWIRNYYGEIGGPQVKLYHKDYYTGDYSPTPEPVAQIYDMDNVKVNFDPKFERSSDLLDQEEIRDKVEDPIAEPWIRSLLANETGQPSLKAPVTFMFNGLEGQGFAPKINYGSSFQVCDLSHPEWYSFMDGDRNFMDVNKGRELTTLRNGGHYRLYLAPAKWRMGVTCRAHYWYISYTESYGVPLDFFSAWFTRPAVYPFRHDVDHTKDQQAINWLGTDYSYDAGVDDAFDRSRGSLDLAHQIIDAQWWTLSEAFVFVLNDPALIALWQYPPDYGDIVLGVGRLDEYGQNEQITWVLQNRDIISEYPRQVIGLFIVPWTVAA